MKLQFSYGSSTFKGITMQSWAQRHCFNIATTRQRNRVGFLWRAKMLKQLDKMQLRYNIQLGRQQMCLVLKQCLLLATVVAYIFPALKKAYPSNRTIQTRVANFFRSFFSILIRSRPLDVTTTAIRMTKMSWQCITFYLYVYCEALNHLYTLSCHVCCCSGSNPHFLECKTPPGSA